MGILIIPLLFGVFGMSVACLESTTIGFGEDADVDTLDEEVVEPTDTTTPTDPEVEPCMLAGTEDLAADEYIIQIRNPECSTAVCVHYNQETFCTHRCEGSSDCLDIAQGGCELDILLGDPEIIGRYCVPPQFSRY